MVNTASQCGLTPQFEGLEKLYQDYQQQGLLILGFPCNQFAQQDPASNEEIGSFCQRNYGVSFPMFAKVDVNGPTAHPLYQYLTTEAKGILGSQSIKWNFTKFLINQKGLVVKRYAPIVKPEKLLRIFNAFWLNGEGVERSCCVVIGAYFLCCIAQLVSDLLLQCVVVI